MEKETLKKIDEFVNETTQTNVRKVFLCLLIPNV